MVTIHRWFWYCRIVFELYESVHNEPTLATIAALIPLLLLGIMALYQLYIDDFEIVWGLHRYV